MTTGHEWLNDDDLAKIAQATTDEELDKLRAWALHGCAYLAEYGEFARCAYEAWIARGACRARSLELADVHASYMALRAELRAEGRIPPLRPAPAAGRLE